MSTAQQSSISYSELAKEEIDLNSSLATIKTNVDTSIAALAKHEKHVKELDEMLHDYEEGPAKVELTKVLERATDRI